MTGPPGTDPAAARRGPRAPYVVLSCAVSLDGYIDDTGPERLVLSHPADLDRVDAERAAADAVLIGAGTLRADNPRLRVSSPARAAARVAAGRPACPAAVVLTASGRLDADRALWDGPQQKLVYCPRPAADRLRSGLGPRAVVVPTGPALSLRAVLDDLAGRGVRRLLVEGGQRVHTRFLLDDLADEIQLAVAPFLVGQPAAPRFVGPGGFPQHAARRMRLAGMRQAGDMALLTYRARLARATNDPTEVTHVVE